jgi:tetratricopeptide (TPR) repeat protein
MKMMKLSVVIFLCLVAACATADTEKMKAYPFSEGERISSRGDESLQKGITLDAIRRYEHALKQFQRTDDLQKIAATNLKLSGVYLLRNDVENARKFIENAKLIIKEEKLGWLEENLVVLESSILISSGKSAEAVKLLKDFAKKTLSNESIRLTIALGRAVLSANDLTESLKFFNHALAVGKGTPFEPAVRVDLARAFLRMNNPQKALEHLNLALEMDKKAEATVVLGDTLHLIGMTYEATLDYSSAAYYYQRALSVNLQTDLTEKAEADRIALSRVKGLLTPTSPILQHLNR